MSYFINELYIPNCINVLVVVFCILYTPIHITYILSTIYSPCVCVVYTVGSNMQWHMCIHSTNYKRIHTDTATRCTPTNAQSNNNVKEKKREETCNNLCTSRTRRTVVYCPVSTLSNAHYPYNTGAHVATHLTI